VSISIPQSSPLANYLAHKDEIDAAIQRTVESGRYILGSEVTAFEEEFAGYLGVSCAVGVDSGTAALYLALRACDIGPGDAVVTVSHTAVATVAAIELCGASPLFVDIEPASFTIAVDGLKAALARHEGWVKAIIPVHLYGHPARMTEILKLAADHGVRVIEDCAQAHGANWDGRLVGTFGDIAAFSFYPTKNLGALGDGGAVATNNEKLGERVRALREYGWEQRFISKVPGVNSRLDELQAAILRVKLRHLDEDNQSRARIAALYSHALEDHDVLTLPETSPEATHVFHQYVIRAKARDSLQTFLGERGVATAIHYPMPVHQQPAYAGRIQSCGSLHETELAAREILSLPMFPELPEHQLKTVIDHMGTWRSRSLVAAAD
jgi:dTDP-4-amino-4,6-dideoxygalactose transaminase